MKKRAMFTLLFTVFALLTGPTVAFPQSTLTSAHKEKRSTEPKPLVTFVELGSVNCIPCKAMQPVMKAIESKYGKQVKVTFYDVWTKENAHQAHAFKVRLIPTQVFLDADGKEFHRHEGFYPEEAIDLVLQGRGLTPRSVK